ncbi:formate/nitrite transporter family protein [Aliiglaciecola sp. LCG003]|uniref:formate/nitrite transporter family protein n=1 Tax=Aliiglaciecola sp. LCG003 TaxID=3053655 RepID=UPI002573CA0C|nr:formate/nitrite transporter family protein [Aliiglaciecola sp. LCG003]WJG07695.1 formate/nitrite transporter family protein [Aliiglaciecola sp. LCG003]
MSDMYGFDAFSATQIVVKVDQIGVKKAKMKILPLIMLGILAGVFIGLGAMLFVLVKSDPTLHYAVSQLLGGLVFCLGLVLVIIAGAELFTGNNLIVMAWADSKITLYDLLRNWSLVCVANLIGAVGLAVLVFLSGHTEMNGGRIGLEYVQIAEYKTSLTPVAAICRGILCNILVCMAVWMALAGRTVVDKVMAILFPITGFVAAGFEHSIANMYFYPMAMLVEQFSLIEQSTSVITLTDFLTNLLFVISGNLVGGAVFVGLVYHVIYADNKP